VNGFQVAYLAALVALTYPAWGRQRHALGLLWANLVVTFGVCLLMDLGLVGRGSATVSMLIVDLATGVALSLGRGVSPMIAWGYAVTVPLYFLAILGVAQIDTTYGLVYIAATAQLGVLAVGSLGNGGGGNRRRVAGRFALGAPARNGALYQGAISRMSASDGVEK
jgi:hypothetical protein